MHVLNKRFSLSLSLKAKKYRQMPVIDFAYKCRQNCQSWYDNSSILNVILTWLCKCPTDIN